MSITFVVALALVCLWIVWLILRSYRRPPPATIVDEAHQSETNTFMLPIAQWVAMANDAVHVLVAGPRPALRIAETLVATRGGYVVVFDPHWYPKRWGGLPAAQTGEEIAGMLTTVQTEMIERISNEGPFHELTIVANDWMHLTATYPLATTLFDTVARLGHTVNVRFVGVSEGESDETPWGLRAVRIYTGPLAKQRVTEAKRNPAILVWGRGWFLIAADDLRWQPVSPYRRWPPYGSGL